MAVSFLIAAQLRGRRPFEFERVSSPLMSAPVLIETMAWVTFPAMTASQTPLCPGEICGTGADGVDLPLSPVDRIAVDGNWEDLVAGHTHHAAVPTSTAATTIIAAISGRAGGPDTLAAGN